MELVESRKVTERIIRIDDLEKCDEVFLVNSLRGWVKAEIKKRSTG
jgi:branched-subunit amino acid aminotransferase/4-amino-4-deoxychorismate lyase